MFRVSSQTSCKLASSTFNEEGGWLKLSFVSSTADDAEWITIFMNKTKASWDTQSDDDYRSLVSSNLRDVFYTLGGTPSDGISRFEDYCMEIERMVNANKPNVRVKVGLGKKGKFILCPKRNLRDPQFWFELDNNQDSKLEYTDYEKEHWGNPGKLVNEDTAPTTAPTEAPTEDFLAVTGTIESEAPTTTDMPDKKTHTIEDIPYTTIDSVKDSDQYDDLPF